MVLLLFASPLLARAAESDPFAWPSPTRENHPWTRWWWLGSAVDSTNLTRQLTLFKNAGIGGVEICPIYGAKGYEQRFIEYLSPQWMEMLAHTTREAKRLDLGVDLTTGTGWPFGGPRVTPDIASARVNLKRYDLAGGVRLDARLPETGFQCLMAVSEKGEQLDLTTKVSAGVLNWTAPAGQWKLYAVSQTSPVMKVKRAAPGGEGSVLDPYSVAAMNRYLADFDKAFAGYHGDMPRSHFHDSFEYYNALWTPDLFREFQSRRGYDLRTQLPALFGEGSEDTSARVKRDYRATISDLHLAYLQRWTEWAHGYGSLTRNQAHGAPGNLVDLYGTVDIPETEIFGSIDEKSMPMNKFSSSAAHVAGRRLSSSESFTWLNEHFHASLADVKQAADYLFLSGVNHIFFHGIPFSPEDAPWPGWQFYAAVNFGPQGGLWHDLPGFNAYVTRCQSILQGGNPANDVLLYFPLDDVFQTPKDLLIPLTVHNFESTLVPHPFYSSAMLLLNRGYGFDFISDHFLDAAQCNNGRVVSGGNFYRAVVVPKCGVMPETTLQKLAQLAKAGASIIFLDHLPGDVPGFDNLEKRRADFKSVDKGAFIVTSDLESALRKTGISRETVVDLGVQFIRRTHSEGHHYFLANRSNHRVDGWTTLGVPARSAILLDPRFESRAGAALLRKDSSGATQVYLQLEPGESCILRTFSDKEIAGPAWSYFTAAGAAASIAGTWMIQFIDGGPVFPATIQSRELGSWTVMRDAEAKRFAGTARYTIEFAHPNGNADDWMLDLGKVCESARLKVNGTSIGGLWSAPFRIPIGKWLKPGQNILEIEVTNLAANRIADMDRRKEKWKYFYDANLASRKGRGVLDASQWPLMDSGLLGPVNLQPLNRLIPN